MIINEKENPEREVQILNIHSDNFKLYHGLQNNPTFYSLNNLMNRFRERIQREGIERIMSAKSILG